MNSATRIERREFKYFLDAEEVQALKRAIRPFTERDDHAKKASTGTYMIESLYFDRADLFLFHENEHESFHRLKLRIRRYPNSPQSPYFFEVKARYGDVIRKSRHAVSEHAWRDTLLRLRAENECSQNSEPDALTRFLDLVDRYAAEPQVVVRYEREPYQSIIDDYARVTFDRRIEAFSADGLAFDSHPSGYPLDVSRDFGELDSLTLVEIKFTQNVPLWLSDIVGRLELGRASCSKYVRAVRATSELPRTRSRRAGLE